MSTKFAIPATYRLFHLIVGIVVFMPLVFLLALLLSSDVSAQPNLRAPLDQGTIYYVDASKTTGANDGSSWTDAFTSLQLALDIAQEGDQIWVAQGVYTPTKRTGEADPRTATFVLVNGVTMYGGFAGTPGSEGVLDGRDWEMYATVLSGDIDGNDVVDARGVVTSVDNIVGENAYHVVTTRGAGDSASLVGFLITAGQASGSHWDYDLVGGGMYNWYANPHLHDVAFFANFAERYGGGLYSASTSPTSLTNVIFTANSAGSDGGGMYIGSYSSTHLTNVTFIANWAGDEGGGLYNGAGNTTILTNSTFTLNSGKFGGGISNARSNTPIRNSIFWENVGQAIYGGHVDIFDSLVQGGCPENSTCTGLLLDTDPRFIRSPNSGDGDWHSLADNDYGDLRLQAGSPAIDAGSASWLPDDITTDMKANPRIIGGAVDLGAHEAFGLKIGNSVTPDSIGPGTAITYTLYFHNYQDTDTVTGIRLSDHIPQEVLITDVKTEGATLTQIGYPPNYVWEIEDLLPQAHGVITLSGLVNPEIQTRIEFTNTASLIVSSGDPELDDNSVNAISYVPGVIYVDAVKTSGANNGSSWTDAFTNLQPALDIANEEDQIWVAQGVYVPSKLEEKDDLRSATFNLVNGVALFGGFIGVPGLEGDMSTRDWQTYPTVLSGDIKGDDLVNTYGVLTTTTHLVGENAYHVVTAARLDESTLLDGFFITSGEASGQSFHDRKGGGIVNTLGNPTLKNIIFSANFADYGGGLYSKYGSLSLNHIIFTANYSADIGGGIYSFFDDLTLTALWDFAWRTHM